MIPWLFGAVGALVVALAVPLLARRVPPNGWYGLRTDATLADERVWYAANARAGGGAVALGVVLVALAVLGVGTWIWLTVATTGMLALAAWSAAVAQSLHRRVDPDAGGDAR